MNQDEDSHLVEGLRQGDEAAFATLIQRYHRSIVRLVTSYVRNDSAGEDVAQETWMGVLAGLAGYEGRCSFRSWVFRIAVNIAKKRAVRDARGVPFSALDGLEGHEIAVDSDRFWEPDERWAGHWSSPPTPWRDAEHKLLAEETLRVVAAAIDELPAAQRQVITLRDMQGLTAEETSEILELNEGNQRVLLHRARSKVRTVLEMHFGRSIE